ncbi:MAG: hypothetical protein ACE37K_00020 [Planctomycetota bacterium]
MRWPHYVVLFALLGAVVMLALETLRLAELAGDFERRAVLAERGLAQRVDPDQVASRPAGRQGVDPSREDPKADAQPATSPGEGAPGSTTDSDDGGVGLAEYSRLQLELHTTRERLAAVRTLLDARNAELARRAAESKQRVADALKPMPAGVRECLHALHQCLRLEGFTAQRFLRATAVDAEGLHDVELLETAADGLGVVFVTAARMTASLDRTTGRLELRFFEGHRSVDGERAALPEDGFAVVFDDVDGQLFERRLPYLVRASGAYPVERETSDDQPGDLDPASRRQWARRLSRLLAQARTDIHWSASRLRGQLDGHFLQVELVGTNDKGLVLGSAHCDRVAVEIDERRNVVSLLLLDGVLRRDGVESTITDRGFRMLLPGLTPKDCSDAMLGIVVKR